MNPQDPNNMTEEQKKALQEELSREIPMIFTKGELILLFNILVKIDMRYGDALAIVPIVKKIEPKVVVDSSKPQANHKQDPIIIGGKNRKKN